MDFFWMTATGLYRFWYRFFAGLLRSETNKSSLIAPPVNKIINQPSSSLILVEEVPSDEPVLEFKTLKSVVENRAVPTVEKKSIPAVSTLDQTLEPNEAAIVKCNTSLYKRNTKEFDSVLKVLPYGATVTIIKEEGSWANISYKNITGWVDRDNITTRISQTKPYFIIKEYCGPESENTKRLRLMINDVFFGGEAGLPLYPEEYIYYKLFSRGILLPASDKRPRRAGSWQKIFQGMKGAHISIRPKTGSILEYTTPEDEGRLAYIEAVFPDESISLSEVGVPESGYYNERMLSKEIWQELKPVFIQFS